MGSSRIPLLMTISFILAFLHAIFALPSLVKTSPPPPHALVLPITKDASTLQYLTTIRQRTPLVPVKLTVHLGGQFMWLDCKNYISSTYHPAICGTALCKAARSGACADECYPSPKPGCNNNTCLLLADNPIAQISGGEELNVDIISILSTDGSNPSRVVSTPRFPFTCDSYPPLLEGLAKGVKGMMGLGMQPISVPSQLASAFSLPRKFAICLSSSTASNGVIFFGNGPYFFLPQNNIDVSKSLMYTRLIKNPVSTATSYLDGEPSAEYFIKVRSIIINGKTVRLNTTLLDIHKGNGGTKISTVHPYTVMERSIYRAVTGTFVKQLAFVPRVAAVAPFKVCYSSKSFSSTRVGPGLPSIDLVLDGQSKSSSPVTWMIFGANSMVPVNDKTLCLGFLDGGLQPRTSIVIGGFQLENNLLEFDIGNSMLGFTSSLLFRQTGCGNFNFTSDA